MYEWLISTNHECYQIAKHLLNRLILGLNGLKPVASAGRISICRVSNLRQLMNGMTQRRDY